MTAPNIKPNAWLFVIGVLVSGLLSIWAVAIDDVINNDGVFYILAAEHIAAGEWRQALLAFKWPGYSFLIYLVQLVPGVEFEMAARVVTTLGFTLVVVAFVQVVGVLGGRGRVLWLALATILVYPGLNEFRSFLIRDSVYLAAYLFALMNLLRYAQTSHLASLGAAFLCLCVAALFRVEAAVFIGLFPLLLIHRVGHRRLRHLLTVLYALIAVDILGAFYGWWLLRPEGTLDPLTLLQSPQSLFMAALAQIADEAGMRLHEIRAGLPAWAPELLAFPMAILMVLWIVLTGSIDALTLPYTILLIVGLVYFRPVIKTERRVARMLLVVLAVHLVILLLFTAARFFLAPRYPVAMTITLALTIPFICQRILVQMRGHQRAIRRMMATTGLVLVFLINAFEGLDAFGHKSHIKDAGRWMRNNVPADSRLSSNDIKFLYYADRHRDEWVFFRHAEEFDAFLHQGTWRFKDYVAVYLRRGDQQLRERLNRTLAQPPIKSFAGEKGDVMLIYYTDDD